MKCIICSTQELSDYDFETHALVSHRMSPDLLKKAIEEMSEKYPAHTIEDLQK
jgi:hypothetical protein